MFGLDGFDGFLSHHEFKPRGHCQSQKVAIIMDIIFWDFLILYQIFFSPKVKRSLIISNKHGIYKLPHELPNDWRLRNLKN